MKILVFTTLYPNAVQPNYGIFVEKRLLELIKRFDIEARVLAPVPWYPKWLAKRRNLPNYHDVPKREVRNGIQIEHPRYPVIPGLSWRFAPTLLFVFCLSSVNRIRTNFMFELIDAHFMFPDGVAASRVAECLGVPCFVTARGSDINDSPNFLLPRWYIKSAFKRINRVIAVSERLKRKLVNLGAEESKIRVLPNGVDTEIFKADGQTNVSETFDIKERYLLSVGSLRELKGHHLVIRALAENPKLREFTLVIAGEGEMRAKLESLIEELSMQERVKLIGDVPNARLPSLYAGAAVFILASSNEGCPNVVLEALACGTPVVASDVGAVPDLLPSFLHQFMVTKRSSTSFSSAIEACITKEISREEIRAHAESLNWDATCA